MYFELKNIYYFCAHNLIGGINQVSENTKNLNHKVKLTDKPELADTTCKIRVLTLDMIVKHNHKLVQSLYQKNRGYLYHFVVALKNTYTDGIITQATGRKIAQKLNLPHSTVAKYIKECIEEGLIRKTTNKNIILTNHKLKKHNTYAPISQTNLKEIKSIIEQSIIMKKAHSIAYRIRKQKRSNRLTSVEFSLNTIAELFNISKQAASARKKVWNSLQFKRQIKRTTYTPSTTNLFHLNNISKKGKYFQIGSSVYYEDISTLKLLLSPAQLLSSLSKARKDRYLSGVTV
jgi:predicted transcriptional regulator